MVGVRGAQHGANPRAKRRLVGLGLAHELAQRALANHGVQGAAHGLVGVLNGRVGEREENPFLAAHPLEIGDQLALHAVLRARVDTVHDAEEQLDEAVGDLGLAARAQGGQQRQAHWRRVRSHPRRVLGARARPPRPQPLL